MTEPPGFANLSKMGKVAFISLVIAALAALLGERILNLRKRTLASREWVQNHLPNCVALKNLDFGSEDITILGNGLAFISTGLKYPGLLSSNNIGKIFTLDMNHPRMKPGELRMPRNFDLESFNPHGISVYVDPSDDSIYLLVVNHPQHKSQIELFKFMEDDHSLVHLKTIKHELLYSVNDVVAVGLESFYATNDHYFTHKILKAWGEPLLGQPWTNVVYYSPEEVKVVSEGYYFANGINMSPDKRHIYVSDVLDHSVHVLEVKEDNALVSVKAVSVGSLCDNVEVDPETGDLWLGCHPNGWQIFTADPKDRAGSEVIQIQNIHSDKPVVTQVYSDDGQVIIGSSVAATYGGKLLIGSGFHKALCCDLGFLYSLRSQNMAAMKKILVAAVAVYIGHRFLKVKEMSLASRELPVKHLCCPYIKNIEYGAQDITVLKDGLAFLSTGLHFPGLPSFSGEPGKMYNMDMLHPKPTPVLLQIKGELDLSSFKPHGISAYVDEADDSVYLFVVNHPQQKSQVEIFHFVQENSQAHLKTITHPLVYNSPNKVRVAADVIMFANGIKISPDKRSIYVSDIMGHSSNVYERKKGEHLLYRKGVAVGSLCDYIEVDHRTGDIWLGCHPNGMKLTMYDPNDPPGSEVIRIKNIHSDQPVVSQEYADNGRVLMASTVAAPYEGKLLIGTVFHKALFCHFK
ncbi:serum paraoxonase/arylesterase 2-like [Spinachia spinachia]